MDEEGEIVRKSEREKGRKRGKERGREDDGEREKRKIKTGRGRER